MVATARSFARRARAKFNLRLEVGVPVEGGLHAVRSAVTELVVCDDLSFLPSAAGFAVSCDDETIPEPENLAWQAARALHVTLPDVRIHIRKGIPVQAGLGGGSSDAAAALLGIAELLAGAGVALADGALLAAAASVGSDVPACLAPGLKVVEGTGDLVHRIAAKAPAWGVLLLKPACGVPTALAYRLLDAARASGSQPAPAGAGHVDEICRAFGGSDFDRACALLHNDFQAPVEAAYPDVAAARARIVATGARSTILCGSGSCVAGLFATVGDAERALAALRPAAGEWAVATGFADGR
jgi:4-diphosphocytidyl-2-C-methyl-D-erythritol kinase